jgi:secreted PhoX family phosphatase
LPGDSGDPAEDAIRLAHYEVIDDLVLPEGFRYEVIAKWGDRFGPADDPARQIVFGYNADFVALIPTSVADEFYLVVNHEYISATPWLQGYPEVYGVSLHENGRAGELTLASGKLDIEAAPPSQLETVRAVRRICKAGLADLGVSILRVRRDNAGGFAVIADASDHRRIHGYGRVNVDPSSPLELTGPAAELRISAPGTFANCSGGVTPWGTVLSCEENFQDQTAELLTPSGRPLPGSAPIFEGEESAGAAGLPFELMGLCSGLNPVPDPRAYGWVCEIDPATGALWKHTALGRFRHENVALRVERGRPLAAYMGDDRRGGHIWKFVSADIVRDPNDPSNRRLFEQGTLFVARFDENFTGHWLPLIPETPLNPVDPDYCADGVVSLPRRPDGGSTRVGQDISLAKWKAEIERYAGRGFERVALGDLVAANAPAQAVLLLDAFLMANAIGGTPCARPEDLEVHPFDRSVYIAFTDSSGDEDGSPDARIFPDSRRTNSRQYGAIFRLVEHDNDPAATTFSWGRFVAAGECAEGGGGFACADNLAFDSSGNLWMVTDITTHSLNFPVNREKNSAPGMRRFPGIFGNNAMFMIPTYGPEVGRPKCFAIGPMECELTGPCFAPDGSLLLAVQHPGEAFGTRGDPTVPQPLEIRDREIHITGRDGRVFVQRRVVPLGSNFPSKTVGAVPRPCVVHIRRA